MDSRTAMIVAVGALFLLGFAAMTFAALSTAEANFASLLAFGFAFLVIILVLIGLIGIIRNPPDE